MVALVGDAELDEGNVFEALLEGWKHDIRNVWWVIDYNRQSLDRVVPERLFAKIEEFFGPSAGTWSRSSTASCCRRSPSPMARAAAAVDRRLPERSVLGADVQGRTGWRQRLEHDLGRLPGSAACSANTTTTNSRSS